MYLLVEFLFCFCGGVNAFWILLCFAGIKLGFVRLWQKYRALVLSAVSRNHQWLELKKDNVFISAFVLVACNMFYYT